MPRPCPAVSLAGPQMHGSREILRYTGRKRIPVRTTVNLKKEWCRYAIIMF
jgi:hypothetical protein